MDVSKQEYGIRRHSSKPLTLNHFCAVYAFLLTAAACLVGSTGNTALMLGITAMFAPLFLKPQMLLGPVLFFTIFDDFLLVGSSASASRFITIFLIVGAVISMLQKGSIKKTSLYFLLLIAFGVVLSFYATYGSSSLPISYVLNIILTIAMINLAVKSTENISKQFYIYAILALAFVYFLFAKNGFDSLVEGTRMTIGEDVNSNQMAMGLAIVMAVLVSNLLLFRKHALLNVLFIGGNLVALFLTGSRTALIASVVTAFLLYIINAQDKRSKRNAFLLLIGSVALLILIYNTLQKYFPILMERFTSESVEETGGSGRLDVWSTFFTKLFPKYWFIGMGFDASNLVYAIGSINAEAHGAHNVLVDILSRSGVVGLILYAVCFVKFFSITLKTLRVNKFLILPIAIVLTTLINGIGENILATRFLWYGIGLGYMFLNTANKENEKSTGGVLDA